MCRSAVAHMCDPTYQLLSTFSYIAGDDITPLVMPRHNPHIHSYLPKKYHQKNQEKTYFIINIS